MERQACRVVIRQRGKLDVDLVTFTVFPFQERVGLVVASVRGRRPLEQLLEALLGRGRFGRLHELSDRFLDLLP